MFPQHVRPSWFENVKSFLTKSSKGLLQILLLIPLLSVLNQGMVKGQTTFTTTLGGNLNWTAATWSKTGTTTTATYPGQVTGETHNVVINVTGNGTGRTITLNQNITQSVNNITINYTGTRTATLALGNNTLTMTGSLSGNGIVTMGSGTLNIAGDFSTTGTFTCGTGTVNYNGNSTQTIDGGTTYYNLSINNSGDVCSSNGAITVSNAFSLVAGGNFSTAYNLTLNGTVSCGGTINASAGTVTYSNNALNVLAGTYYSLSLSATATHTACGNIIVNSGTLTNAANSILNMSTYVLSGTGTFTNNGTIITSCLTATSATPIPTGKSWAGTIQYAASNGSQTIVAATSYTNLTLLNTSGTNISAAALTVNGIFTTTAGGTLDMGTSALTVATVSNSGTVKTSNTSATPITTGKTWGGTVEYAALGGSQTIMTATYNNLTLDNTSGTNTAAGIITVSGAYTATSGGTFSTGYNLSLNGITSCGGNITATAGTVTYGSAALNIIAGSYTNLTLSAASDYTQCGAVSVSNTLAFSTNGATLNSAYDLTMTGGTITNPSYCTLNATAGTVYYNNASLTGLIKGTYFNLNTGTADKTLLGTTVVNGTITWNTGNIILSTFGFTLGSSSGISSSGSFGSTHMFQCNGATNTGSLIVQSANAAGLVRTYPVGSGTSYTPMTITSLTGTVTNPASITINTVPTYYTAGGAVSSDLNRYWNVTSGNLSGITANLNFTYLAADVPGSGTETSYETSYYSGGTWSFNGLVNSGSHIASASSISGLSGVWTARKPAATYYSYQSGPWNNSNTWTTDASGTLWVNAAVPGAGDNVVILNGRTVTAQDAGRTIGSLEIREGGILDIGTITTHSFGTVSGQGTLRINSGTFPSGTFDDFVAAGGGTVEYYNIGTTATPLAISTSQLTYNNLIISNSSATARSVYWSNTANITYKINGDFTLLNTSSNPSTYTLTLNFGNPSGTSSDNLITMTVDGDFSVSAGCIVGVNNFATNGHSFVGSAAMPAYPAHTINFLGDFTNNGTVRFTGLPSTTVPATLVDYYSLTNNQYSGTNYGVVQAYFKGASNNTLTCNGTTDFFRLVLEKGNDQTYTLEVNCSNSNNFALYGPNFQGQTSKTGGLPEDLGWGVYYKALFIHYGTLKLNDNITIPSLTEGGLDFNVCSTAQLWVNGANVSTTISGDNAPNDGHSYTNGSYQALTLVGTLRISSGQLSTGDATGIVLHKNGTPLFQIEGTGILDISEFWVDKTGSNLMSYIQTGGSVNVRMDGQSQSGPMMDLGNTTTVFKMSGGTINFTNNTFNGGTTLFNVLDIEAAPGNYDVTGGTINFNLPSNGTTYYANSTVPLYNLNISRNASTTTGTTSVQWNTTGRSTGTSTNLTILNNLSVGANTLLNLNTNKLDLNIGNDFTIASGGTYTPGTTNTTTFNGTGNQTFDVEGTLSGNLNNLTLSGTTELTLLNANPATPIVANGNFTIGSGCTLIDNGRILELNGSTGTVITNNGTHYRPASGAGSIRLTGTAAQTITGDGNGKFNNLTLYKTGGSVTMSSDMAVTGELRLAGTTNGVWNILNIGSNHLSLDSAGVVYSSLNTAAQAFNNNRMIRTNGLMSDAGVSKRYTSTGAFVFPFGFYTNATYYYMPAKIQFTGAPSKYGTVTTRPVNATHPLAQSVNILSCYWKTESEGFTGIPASTVKHQYVYNDYFLHAGDAENNYVPGFYNNSTYSWSYLNNTTYVYETPDSIVYNTASAADGDFTAGYTGAFGAVTVLYSVRDGDWDTPATWNTHIDGTGTSGVPNSSTVALIVNNHTVTINAAGRTAGGLSIESGSTLDLGIYTGHNFEAIPNNKISGSGTLRIGSSGYFPRGDFGNFIGENGGTVEYYTGAGATPVTSITVPTSSDVTALSLVTYKNLILNTSAGAAHTITLPATNVTVYGNMTVKGNGTTTATGVGTPATTGRTYTIEGNLNITSGLLEYRNPVVNTITVKGNTRIASGAAFRTHTNVTATVYPVLNLYGNLTNFGTFDMYNTGQVSANFIGTVNDTIRGTGTYDFYTLTCDKGSDTSSVLTLRAAITTHPSASSNFLTLNNGTFRVDTSTVSVGISTSNAFLIPSTACFSVKNGLAIIGTGSDAGDVSLSGKLEVLGGSLNIGNNSGNNNDIEYAAAGTPTIHVTGGALNVSGQIRRLVSNTSGSLIYDQSGGDVIIYGQNNQATRAKLEITNSGKFIMSAGSITLFSAGGTTYYDLYLRPETDSVTGGTIYLGSGAPGLTFGVVSAAPLWNVVVGTASASETAQVNVLPIAIQNQLTINAGSVFNANSFDVNLGGSLTNNNTNASTGIATGGYRAGTATQTTTFEGSLAQSITGSGSNLTNFANLVINKTGNTLSLTSGNIRVNSDFTLTSGTLADGGNTVYLAGDVENNDTHTSSSTSGGMNFVGSSEQILSGDGTGVFGNVILNNALGVDMVDNSTINGRLTFTTGSLYIDDYLLTLGAGATISGTTNASKMIIVNGVLSDRGVKKIFASGNTDPFTFPVGVSGKYTPAAFDFSANANSNGSITIIPVNDLHKSVTGSPTDYLSYFWDVAVSGLSSAYTVTYQFNYDDKDIHGTETNYVAQRYDAPGNTWYTNSPTGTLTPASNYFSFAGVSNYLAGEYTVGQAYSAQPILYSITDGNWATVGTWSTTQGGTSCGCTPNGNPVVIVAGTTVTLATNTADAYSVTINGTLDASTTTFHDLGRVSGPGKLVLTATSDGMFVFPGGEYDAFMANTSSTVEFTGSTDGTLPLKPGNLYKPYQNVIFSGTGIKYMSAEDLKINGNMTISSVTSLNNTLYNKNLEISGNWTDQHTTSGGFVPGTGMVSFVGTAAQNMVLGYTESFYNLAINNSHGVDMTSGTAGLTVSKNLYLTSGNFITATGKLITITNTATSAIIGGSTTSFVDGPLCKRITSGQSFIFPVGDGSRFGQVVLTNTSASTSPADWTASYFNADPNTAGYLTGSTHYSSPITGVSNNEYWVINRPTGGGSANIRLRYDATSYPAFTSSSTLRSRLRVVEYEAGTTGFWTQRGALVSGNSTSGTVSTTTAVTNNDYVFSIGVIGVTASITTSGLSYSICDNGEIAYVPITLSGTAPWTLVYRTTGTTTTNFTQTGITSSSYQIALTGSNIGGYSATPYTLSLVSVSDAAASGTVTAITASITVKQTYTPSITGAASVGTGETRTYSTPSHTGSTYAWSWVSTSMGTINSAASASTTVTFSGTAQGPYQLQVVETSSSGCTASSVISITSTTTPTPSITPTTSDVCQGDVIVYSTTLNGTNTYAWTVTNGTCTSGCNTNSATITWNGSGNGSLTVTETRSGISGTDTKNYTISIMPQDRTLTTAAICSGNSGGVLVPNSELNISYQLYLSSGTAVGLPYDGTSANLTIPTGVLTGTTNYYVTASNEGCSRRIPASPSNITLTVNATPTVTISEASGITETCEENTVTLNASPSGLSSYLWSWNWITDGTVNNTATGSSTTATQSTTTPGLVSNATYPNNTTTVTYSVSATSAQGCTGSSTYNILVHRKPDTGPEYHISNDYAQ